MRLDAFPTIGKQTGILFQRLENRRVFLPMMRSQVTSATTFHASLPSVFCYPKAFRGRLFSKVTARRSCAGLTSAKSVPFGKNQCISPFVCSLRARSHGHFSCAKYTSSFRALSNLLKLPNSMPLSTVNGRPWFIRVAGAFCDRAQASAFETYLKSHSARVFASRHF